MLKQKLDNVGVLIKYDATSLNSQIIPYVLLQKKDWLHPVPERRNSWTLVGGTIKGNNQSPEALKGEIERVIKEELLGGNDLAVCELFTELKEYGSPTTHLISLCGTGRTTKSAGFSFVIVKAQIKRHSHGSKAKGSRTNVLMMEKEDRSVPR
jgi:hypothetical protein